MTIDLNCDLGEISGLSKSGNDALIMPWITSANIACGFHAGDPLTIERTIRLALIHKVAIGAHPGYPDREGFGRKTIQMTGEELRASLLYQVGAVKSMAEALGGKLAHVKPHGALYNLAATDRNTADIIAQAVKATGPSLILYGLAGSQLIEAAKSAGLAYASEAFADRAYNEDGTLVSRALPGAVLYDAVMVVNQVLRMVKKKTVETITGKIIPIQVDTLCIHGDNEMAAGFARKLCEAFRKNGITLSSAR